jgi:hypothetical protein
MVLQTPMGRSALKSTFNAVVAFTAPEVTFAPYTIVGAVNFTIAAGAKLAPSRVFYHLVSNGVNVPTFTGFVESIGSSGFINTNGVVNILEIFWNGSIAFYGWSQERYVAPAFNSIALSFPTVNASFTNPSANTYSSNSTTAFSGIAASAQTIPVNKDGRVSFKVGGTTLIGLKTTSAADGFTGWNYYAWIAGTAVYSGASGVSTDSGFVVSLPCYLQLERIAGTVKAYYKQNVGDAWTVYRTFPVNNTAALFVGLHTTSPATAELASFEVAP